MKRLVTEYVQLADMKCAFSRYGSGPVLILLHGNSGSKWFFRRYQLEYFPMFHTIAVDSRGHGKSRSEDTFYSIEQYSEDVISLCAQLGITRAAVVGHSDGGNIALFLAKKAPQLFHKVVAISPNYLVSGLTESSLKLTRKTMNFLVFLRKLGFNTRKSIMRCSLVLNDIGITDEDLQSIRTDVEILYAEHDMIREEHIQQLGRLIPDARVKKIRKSNHMSILNKRTSIEEITAFLLDETAEGGSVL